MALKFFKKRSTSTSTTDSGESQLLLAAGYESGCVVMWDFQSRKALGKMKLHSEPCKSQYVFGPTKETNTNVEFIGILELEK
jgi:hypothetical protein